MPEKSQINVDPMKVHNMRALIDRWGQDCHEHQWCRELTHNAIQTCQIRAKKQKLKETHIKWDFFDYEGQSKICIVDTGEGMTGREMIRYINQLASSGEGRGDTNFGIGAKIACLTKSPYGILYISFKEGVGEMVHLCQTNNTYGVLKNAQGDVVSKVPKSLMHPLIKTYGKGTGTMVVLLGQNEEHDTTRLLGSDSMALEKYLNARYMVIPKNVTIRVKSRDKDQYERQARGQRYMLDAAALAKGTVDLPKSKAKAHWWVIVKDGEELPNPVGDNKREQKLMHSFTRSHSLKGAASGFVLEDEIYDGQNNYHRIQRCGIPFHAQQVAIYFEPNDSEVTSNSSRTHLMRAGQVVQWDTYAEEFRQNLPEELIEVLDRLEASPTNRKGGDKSKSDLLRASVERFLPAPSQKNPRQKAAYRDPNGEPVVNLKDALGESGLGIKRNPIRNGEERGESTGETREPTTRKNSPEGEDKRKLFGIKMGGAKGRTLKLDIKEPGVQWYSQEKRAGDLERTSGYLEGVAAHYDDTNNIIHINRDFVWFQSWVEWFVRQYPELPKKQTRQLIEEIVEGWWAFHLKEAVMLYPQSSKLFDWPSTIDDITLTIAVMARHNMGFHLKRDIYNALKKPKSAPKEIDFAPEA